MNRLLVSILFLKIIANKVTADPATWDQTISYRTVFNINATDYISEQSNISRIDEGTISYWAPIQNGSDGILTQRFTFENPIVDAFLDINYIYIANFSSGSTYGYGSLSASKNGTDWVQLLDAPTPLEIAAGYSYSNYLPNSLLGSSDLWLKATLRTEGWNIMAQFLRYDLARTDNAFSLKVNLAQVPEASGSAIFSIIIITGLTVLKSRRNRAAESA